MNSKLHNVQYKFDNYLPPVITLVNVGAIFFSDI